MEGVEGFKKAGTNKKIEIQNKSKTYIGNNVICESFDQFDFSKEGK